METSSSPHSLISLPRPLACSTPDKPVHCVVWAKELHKLLLGDRKASYLFEGQTHAALLPRAAAASGDAASDATHAAPDTSDESSYMRLVQSLPPAGTPEAEVRSWAVDLCVGVFHDDIAKARAYRRAGLLRLRDSSRHPPPLRQRLSVAADSYKTALRRPAPIDVRALLASAGGDVEGGDSSASVGVLAEQRVLTPAGSLRLFVDTLVRMYVNHFIGTPVSCPHYLATAAAHYRFTCPETRTAVGSLEFTKDSPADVDFVTGATNLRAHTFGIPVRRAR